MDQFSTTLLHNIACFLGASDVVSFARCKRIMKAVALSDSVWSRLCQDQGYKPKAATRTRGKKPMYKVYNDNVCAECSAPGQVVLNIDSSLLHDKIALCHTCFDCVVKMATWTERKKKGVPKIRQRHGDYIADQLFTKIPQKKRKRK